MNDINQIRFSVAVNSIAAIAMGWASVVLTAMSRTLVAGIAGIVVMVVLGFIVQFATKNKDKKWWLSNGVVIFLLVVPVFLRVIGVPMGGDLWELIRVCVACIAPRSNVVDSQP